MRAWRATTVGILTLALLAGPIVGTAMAQGDEPPTYEHAAGITFEHVEPSVWKVIDPNAPRTTDSEYPEWHQGVEVAPDDVVWVWGPGGIRALGGSPIGDDPADWEDSMSGIVSKAAGLTVSMDGTVWANIDSQIRSFDGTSWTTHELDWAAITPPGSDDSYAMLVNDLPDGTVCATWETWYDEGYERQTTLACFDGSTWTEHEAFRDIHAVLGIAGTPDGDVWVGVSTSGPTVLMRRHGDIWEEVELPSAPMWSVPAAGIDGALWMTVERPEDSGSGCSALARLADGAWSMFVPDDVDTCGLALFGLEVAPDGTVWIAGDGVTTFDGVEWRSYLEDTFPMDIAIAPDGTVWVAAAEGVYVIRPETTRSALSTSPSLPGRSKDA
jgi:hypothetical protein